MNAMNFPKTLDAIDHRWLDGLTSRELTSVINQIDARALAGKATEVHLWIRDKAIERRQRLRRARARALFSLGAWWWAVRFWMGGERT